MVAVTIFAILTVLVLVTGIILMAIGGKLNHKLKSKLMFLRVAMQGAAICLLFVLYLSS